MATKRSGFHGGGAPAGIATPEELGASARSLSVTSGHSVRDHQRIGAAGHVVQLNADAEDLPRCDTPCRTVPGAGASLQGDLSGSTPSLGSSGESRDPLGALGVRALLASGGGGHPCTVTPASDAPSLNRRYADLLRLSPPLGPASASSEGAGPGTFGTQATSADALAVTLAELREVHRNRELLVRQKVSLELAMQSLCRRLCDGDKTEGGKLYRQVCATKPNPHPLLDLAAEAVRPLRESCRIIEKSADDRGKRLVVLAKRLAVWPWVEGLPGVGAMGLGQIVAEAGDLASYSNPARLWKRMGVGLVDGERQRLVSGNAELNERHGYSKRRRKTLWVLSDSAIKKQGPLREIYLLRKAYEIEATPGLKPNQYHLRALRYMSKRFLRELWREWRRCAGVGVKA